MKDEYVIINKTAIQKRIEECNKCLTFVNKKHDAPYQKEIDVLQSILSQSTPLIPEIEKAHNTGRNYGCYLQGVSYDHNDNIDSEDYISNLKLDI